MPLSDVIACLTERHDLNLVVIAVLICVAACLCVFRIRSRMRHTEGLVRAAWIFLSGLEAGCGVWATHFIAMLAFRPGVAAGYDPLGTLASLLFAVTGCTLAFAVAWTGAQERSRMVAGGLLLTLAIGLMHFTGMAAYRVQAAESWNPAIIWVGMALGTGLATLSLSIGGRTREFARQCLGAALFAGAICAVHFLAMGALSLTPDPSIYVPPQMMDENVLAFIVVMLAVLIILGGLGAAYIDDESSRHSVIRLRRLADSAREGIVVLLDGRINDANAAFCALAGASPEVLAGRSLLDELLQLDEPDPFDLSGERREGALRPIHAEEELIPVEVYIRDLEKEAGAPPMSIVSVRDLREQRAAQDRIRFLAEHDPLTGLPNRRAVQQQLDAAIERVRRTEEHLAVVSVDLDDFRAVNDLHGHGAGDALLISLGQRLKTLATGASFAGRLGGDEFVFVYVSNDADTVAKLADWASGLVASLSRPVIYQGQPLDPTASVGVSVFPIDGADASSLMSAAEAALSRAKEAGRNSFAFFKREMDVSVRERRALARDLKQAIAEDQLLVYYQPQARTCDGSLSGFEALVRWVHPVKGFLPPDQFVSIAEESGLIADLGAWVLRRACADAASWPKPAHVAVNLSPLQVTLNTLPALVHEVLIETGLSPARLELEITESALIHDFQAALDTLRRLKALGVRIAMDDFGTGYSSLSTLHSFPFDKIKIDKSFVEGIGVLERSTVIVRAVLGIGRGLNIPVVAEGVETLDQYEFLQREACAEVQGYFIGRPGPSEAWSELFEADTAAPQPPRTTDAASADAA